MKRIAALATAIILTAAGSAFAVAIDFRTFTIPAGTNSYYYADAGLTITAHPDNATLYQDSEDGIGVQFSYENDEIEGIELLNLHFDEEQYLTSMLISDLFYEPYNYSSGSYQEIGFYSFDSFNWIDFIAPEENLPSPATNGELEIALAPTAITDIWFKASGFRDPFTGALNLNQDHEFSVARIDVQAVPEPSTLLLLGTGLIGLAAFRKRTVS